MSSLDPKHDRSQRAGDAWPKHRAKRKARHRDRLRQQREAQR